MARTESHAQTWPQKQLLVILSICVPFYSVVFVASFLMQMESHIFTHNSLTESVSPRTHNAFISHKLKERKGLDSVEPLTCAL